MGKVREHLPQEGTSRVRPEKWIGIFQVKSEGKNIPGKHMKQKSLPHLESVGCRKGKGAENEAENHMGHVRV